METFSQAVAAAFELMARADAELIEIIGLSLRVSLTATALAFLAGAPLGAALAVARFRGRRALIVLVNALFGLPPVVVGLVVYLLVSRAGPFGALGLLFTPVAMVAAQFILTLPIVMALSHRAIEPLWADYGDALIIDGASYPRVLGTLIAMARAPLVTCYLAAFGRAIAEVGAIIIVGGNIRHSTRTMTTAIALETSKGDLALALALGLVLVTLAVIVSAAAFVLNRAPGGR